MSEGLADFHATVLTLFCQRASVSFNAPRLGRVSCQDPDPLQRPPKQTRRHHPSAKGQACVADVNDCVVTALINTAVLLLQCNKLFFFSSSCFTVGQNVHGAADPRSRDGKFKPLDVNFP